MAELLVRVVSKVNPSDVYKDVKLTKRGDVIVAQPDGWGWSDMEKTNPDWRIFKWPSVTVSEASVFLSPELPIAPKASPDMPDDPMLQRRGFNIDVDLAALPASLRQYLSDMTRAQSSFDVPAQITISMVKRQKERRVDPAVIG